MANELQKYCPIMLFDPVDREESVGQIVGFTARSADSLLMELRFGDGGSTASTHRLDVLSSEYAEMLRHALLFAKRANAETIHFTVHGIDVPLLRFSTKDSFLFSLSGLRREAAKQANGQTEEAAAAIAAAAADEEPTTFDRAFVAESVDAPLPLPPPLAELPPAPPPAAPAPAAAAAAAGPVVQVLGGRHARLSRPLAALLERIDQMRAQARVRERLGERQLAERVCELRQRAAANSRGARAEHVVRALLDPLAPARRGAPWREVVDLDELHGLQLYARRCSGRSELRVLRAFAFEGEHGGGTSYPQDVTRRRCAHRWATPLLRSTPGQREAVGWRRYEPSEEDRHRYRWRLQSLPDAAACAWPGHRDAALVSRRLCEGGEPFEWGGDGAQMLLVRVVLSNWAESEQSVGAEHDGYLRNADVVVLRDPLALRPHYRLTLGLC